jgi:hypothetical protein
MTAVSEIDAVVAERARGRIASVPPFHGGGGA